MDTQLTQTHCRTPLKTPGFLHPGNLSSGFTNIIEAHSGSWKIFPIKSLSSNGEERKEQTGKKEGGKKKKTQISDLEKELNRQVLGAGGKKETHPEGDAKWKTNYNSVDTKDLKTYLL